MAYFYKLVNGIDERHDGNYKKIQLIVLFIFSVFIMFIGIKYEKISFTFLLSIILICVFFEILEFLKSAIDEDRDIIKIPPYYFKDSVDYCYENIKIIELIVLLLSFILSIILLFFMTMALMVLYAIILILVYRAKYPERIFQKLGIENNITKVLIFICVGIIGFMLIKFHVCNILFAGIFSVCGSILFLASLETSLKQDWGYSNTIDGIKEGALPHCEKKQMCFEEIEYSHERGIFDQNEKFIGIYYKREIDVSTLQSISWVIKDVIILHFDCEKTFKVRFGHFENDLENNHFLISTIYLEKIISPKLLLRFLSLVTNLKINDSSERLISCKYSPNHTQNKLNLEYFDSYNLIIETTAVIIWTQFLKKDHKNNIFVRLLNLSNITSIGLAPEDSCEYSMELASNQYPMILRNKHASRISDKLIP
ncbi:hypothetical protein CWI36_0208p0040 [Hamiltosporidium magnivora]|uniref:Uncharacterized protein n=1 Tax=Hamiltosporidium magnivora TaxID=148818 RepID=A0A4Q9LK64_9MICR|nr:hypothetical protein CWI36_0208p0040 [Hamiltosporidium magnivora]